MFCFGDHEVDEGDSITVDGDHGLVFEGQLEITIEHPTALIEPCRAWETPAPLRDRHGLCTGGLDTPVAITVTQNS